MRIWVTRTLPDNSVTAANLTALGHEPVVVPVLAVRPLIVDLEEQRSAAVIFTSSNGVRHHPKSADRFDLPVFAVGDTTANAASDLGYRNVWSANGDVTALQRLILDTLPPSPMIHFSGRHSAGDLKAYLEPFGYQIRRQQVYEAQAVPLRWLLDVRQMLPTIDGIVVHSPRGAQRVARLLRGLDWSGQIWCISSACTRPFIGRRALEVSYARHPVEAAVMDLIVADQFRRQSIVSPIITSGQRRRLPRPYHNDNVRGHVHNFGLDLQTEE